MATKKGQRRITYGRSGTATKIAYAGRRKRRGASPAFKKLEARKLALERRYRNLREKTKDKAGPVGGAICTASGGAIAGAVNTTPFAAIMGIPTPLIIGVAGTAFGIYSDTRFSSQIACVSTGMLAKFAGDWSESMMAGGALAPLQTVGGTGT